MKKGKIGTFKVVAIIFLCLLVGGGIYFFTNYRIVIPANSNTNKNTNTSAVADPTKKPSSTVKVSIGSGEGSEGKTVTIPVKFSSVPKKGIDGCDFKLKYDTTALEMSDVQPADIIGSTNKDGFSTENDDTNGVISVLFMDTTGNSAITKNGSFMNITFKVKSGAKKGDSKITLDSVGAFADKDLNEIGTDFSAGKVTIK
ncbi:MAG: cohesin domain-containing protein [Bacillota bacterium]|nr:cohesin domain-containing protein [Bacillota bacterium]